MPPSPPRAAAATVIGIDYVPSLLDRARRRADAEGLHAEFVEGDAEALPFRDGRFDVVSSVFGAMFAPDQERTASELVRVCRPGGRIGLVAHTPDGFIGQLFKAIGRHVPPPAGVRSPIQWGTEERLRELFGDAIGGLRAAKRLTSSATARPRRTSTTGGASTARRSRRSRRSARPAERRSSRPARADRQFNRADDGTMVVPSEYLEAVIVKR